MTPPPVPARPVRDPDKDAFYIDEEDTVLDASTQCPLNKFRALDSKLVVQNPLDASVAAAVTGRPATLIRAETIPQASQRSAGSNVLFASQTLRDSPPAVAKVSLFFGPGFERNIHGLHRFFDNSPDRVLITVHAVEAAISWAIGITSKQIDDSFTAGGLAGQKWQVEIMGGYSTGYHGVNGTINNKLIPLDKLKTVIFYDALYSGDLPAPGGNTKLMLGALDASVKVVVYDVTIPGTPHPFQVTLPADAITIDLKTNRPALYGLVLARVLEKGLKDNYVKPAEVPAAIQNLINRGLPARGSLASAPGRKADAAAGTLDDWAAQAANAPDIATAASDAVVAKVYPIIRDRELMAWQMALPGGILHAGYIPEFGWEFLSRDP